MRRIGERRVLGLLGACALLLTSGCSSAGSAPGASARPFTGPLTRATACRLLTQEEAAKALGAPVQRGSGVGPSTKEASACEYVAGQLGASVFVDLVIMDKNAALRNLRQIAASCTATVTHPRQVSADAVACTGGGITDSVSWESGAYLWSVTVNNDVSHPAADAAVGLAETVSHGGR